MAKQQKAGQYVRKETFLMVSLLCLAVGFFGGVVFTVFKSDSRAPAASVPAQMGTPAPAGSDRIAARKRMAEAEPGNANAWTELGNAYFDSDQFDASINAYRKSLELNPNNPNVWTDMGVMYRRSGKPEEAIKAFDQAIAADPKHEVSRMNKGIVLLHDLNDANGAIKAWEGLLAVNPIAVAPNGISIDQMVTQLKKQQAAPGAKTQ
ncbi:MAG: tetratricopeptide repeat protein [Deltaproteobacteria bacterium]|nr:tetratricopeptide repeat protein [Deltaproteobacteria bacterium]